MAKANIDKMDVAKVTKHGKKDKKPSESKVTKHSHKHKKSKKLQQLKHKSPKSGSDSSDNQNSQVGLTNHEQAQEIALAFRRHCSNGETMKDCGTNVNQDSAEEGRASIPNEFGSVPIQKMEDKAARAQQKEYAKLREEALTVLTEREMVLSITKTDLHFEAEKEHQRQTKLQEEGPTEMPLKKTVVAEALNDQAADGGDIFMIDVNPTPVNPEKLQPPPAEEDQDVGNRGASVVDCVPFRGKSRAMRRRLVLLEREKAKIQQKLGVDMGSDEKATEVQKRLDEWEKQYVQKLERREKKQKDRKRKLAARVRNKKNSRKEEKARQKASRSSSRN